MASGDIGPKIVLEGEKEYRNAIADINREQRVLTSEMKKVSAEFDGNANSIEALQKKNNVLNKEYEEQVKKIRTLQGALENAEKVYGANSKEVQEWQVKLNNAETGLSKLDKELQTNDKYLEEAKKSTDGTAKSIDEFGKEVKIAGEKSLQTGDIIKANLASEVIIQGVKALGSAMKSTAEGAIELATGAASYADDIITMSTQTGIATDKLQAYNYMAELTDVSMEVMTKTMAKNIKSMDGAKKGTKDYVDAYEKLNVEVVDGNGNLRDSEKVYWEAVDALGKMANETERDALAMRLFGKSAQEINPLIAIGSKGVSEFTKEAKEMGAILSDETMDSLGETDDALQRFYQSTDIAKRKFGAEMAPAITKAAEKITDEVTNMDDEFAEFAGNALNLAIDGLSWVMDNAGTITGGIAGIATGMAVFKVGSAIQTGMDMAIGAWKSYKAGVELATIAQNAMNVSQLASPVGLLAAGVGLATGAIVAYSLSTDKAKSETDLFTDKINENLNASKEVTDSIKDNIATRKESTEKIEAEYGAVKKLSDKLFDLSDKEKKSNSEKAEMAALVEQINEAMPELNLEINKETGLITKQRSEVDKLIDSNLELAKINAAKEDFSRIAEDQYNAEKELNEALEERVEIEKKIEELRNSDTTDINKWHSEISNLKQSLEDTDAQIEVSKQTIADLGIEWNQTSDYISKNESIQDTTAKIVTFGDTAKATSVKVTEANAEQVASLQEAQTKYQETLDTTTQDIYNSMGLFDEFAKNTEISGQTLLDNLQSQIEGMDNWAANMQSLSKRGIAEGLLQELYDMGPAAAGEVEALNSMTDKELEKYSSKWLEKTRKSRTYAEQQTSSMRKEIEDEIKKLPGSSSKVGESTGTNLANGIESKKSIVVKDFRDIVSEGINAGQSESNNAEAVGRNIASGMERGVTNGKFSFINVVRDMAASAIEAARKKLDINSPSRVFEEIGEYTVEGFIGGVRNKTAAANKEIEFAMPTDVNVNGTMLNTSNRISGTGLNNSGGPLFVLEIGEFNNYTSEDLEVLADDLAFMTKRRLEGGGISVSG